MSPNLPPGEQSDAVNSPNPKDTRQQHWSSSIDLWKSKRRSWTSSKWERQPLEPINLVRRTTTRAIELEKISNIITSIRNKDLYPKDLRDQYDPKLANTDRIVNRDLPDKEIDDSGVVRCCSIAIPIPSLAKLP